MGDLIKRTHKVSGKQKKFKDNPIFKVKKGLLTKGLKKRR